MGAALPLDCRIPCATILSPRERAMKFNHGNWKILDHLGEASYQGDVYLAHDLARTFGALKLLRTGRDHDLESIKRFIREIRTTNEAGRWHPNVTRYLDGDDGDAAGEPYLVTEYVRGKSLQQRFGPGKQEQLDPAAAAAIVGQAAAGIAHLHKFPYVHRDLKPGNILIADDDGTVKVVDLGSVRKLDGKVTRDSAVFGGWIRYLSPEHLKDPDDVDKGDDVFQLAGVLYFLLTKRDPFGDVRPHQWRDAWKIRLKAAKEMSSGRLRSELCCPPNLVRIAERMFDARERRPSAEEVEKELKAFARGKVPAQLPNSAAKATIRQSALQQPTLFKRVVDSVEKALAHHREAQPLDDFYRHDYLPDLFGKLLEEAKEKEDMDVQLRPPDRRTLLSLCLEMRDVSILKNMLKYVDRSAEVNGCLPLHVAARLGNWEAVQLLIDSYDADVTALTKAGATVLYEAAFSMKFNREAFDRLIDEYRFVKGARSLGAWVNHASVDGFTPLMVAVWRPSFECFKWLLEHSADWKGQDERGESVFAKAVVSGNLEVTCEILRRMAAGLQRKHAKKSLLELAQCYRRGARRYDRDNSLNALMTSAHDGNKDLFDQSWALCQNEFRRKNLKDLTIYHKFDDYFERTVLHEAAERGHYQIVEQICERIATDRDSRSYALFANNKHGRRPSEICTDERIRAYLLEKEYKFHFPRGTFQYWDAPAKSLHGSRTKQDVRK